jgi:uncharacterized membrane protein
MTEHVSRPSNDDAPASKAKDVDATAMRDATQETEPNDSVASTTLTIDRPRQDLYDFWRDLTNLPAFMENIERIDVVDARLSHWIVEAPAGQTVEWDSIITEDRPGQRIAWESTPQSAIHHSGSVQFRDSSAGRGTEVTATVIYDPPGGAIGKAVAKVFQREPAIQVRRELRRFKQLMETGEIATSEPPDAAPRGE